jgi:hypothetical protein
VRRAGRLYHAALRAVRQRAATYESFQAMLAALLVLRQAACLGPSPGDQQQLRAAVLEDWLDALDPRLHGHLSRLFAGELQAGPMVANERLLVEEVEASLASLGSAATAELIQPPVPDPGTVEVLSPAGWLPVLRRLDPGDLRSVALACRHLHTAVGNPELWRDMGFRQEALVLLPLTDFLAIRRYRDIRRLDFSGAVGLGGPEVELVCRLAQRRALRHLDLSQADLRGAEPGLLGDSLSELASLRLRFCLLSEAQVVRLLWSLACSGSCWLLDLLGASVVRRQGGAARFQVSDFPHCGATLLLCRVGGHMLTPVHPSTRTPASRGGTCGRRRTPGEPQPACSGPRCHICGFCWDFLGRGGNMVISSHKHHGAISSQSWRTNFTAQMD